MNDFASDSRRAIDAPDIVASPQTSAESQLVRHDDMAARSCRVACNADVATRSLFAHAPSINQHVAHDRVATNMTTDHERRVLVVDDNVVNIEIMHELLDGEFSVRTAMTGHGAMDVAAAFAPHVVLLDVMLPDTDGYTVCRKMRSDPRFAQVCIIMVSAKAMQSERDAGLKAGADHYVTKPFEEQDVLQLVTDAFTTPIPLESSITATSASQNTISFGDH